MSIWNNWRDLLPGLMPAAYRGITFHVVDSRHEVGRRILLTWFPGMDTPAGEDFGRLDGPIDLRALIVGEDYIARALALQGAFQSSGIGTLLHPWLGEKRVLMERPAQLTFTDRQLGVLWFDASFTPVEVSRVPVVDTASMVLSAADSLVSAAGSFASGLMDGTMAVATQAQAHAAASSIAGVMSGRVALAPEAAGLTPLVRTAVDRVSASLSGAA